MTDNGISVLVNGTGTIGEPLISLLLGVKDKIGIDEVVFYKHTPRLTDRPMLQDLIRRGGKLCVEESKRKEFEELGVDVSYSFSEALESVDVVADATKEGVGLRNKQEFYSKVEDKVKGFLAQGSEAEFGTIYASGINDEIFISANSPPKYVQIASCNTHASAAAVKHFGFLKGNIVKRVNLTLIRRASDVSQEKSVPAPTVTGYKYGDFGTHHAKDVYRLFETLGHDLDIFSSAMKVNTQYMHSLQGHFEMEKPVTREEILEIIENTPQLAGTEKTSVNRVFSFGRDHGYYGRILNQLVVVKPSIKVTKNHLYFWGFVPQDGNSILSSVQAILYYLYEVDEAHEMMHVFDRWIFNEV
ncbi:MAG: hypothetical protein D6732_01460 [Methanobacteriota archaeon]|nr:MAG: hypothetical protein D6732_01460 [Euryarchaeota archaeon]